MTDQTIVFPSVGEAIVNTSYQNNKFVIGWGGDKTYIYQKDNVIYLDFINGEWSTYDYDKFGMPIKVSSQQIIEFANGILSNPVLFKKLKSYTDGALKRLQKSVPRLQKEYETAKNTKDILENIDWNVIKLK